MSTPDPDEDRTSYRHHTLSYWREIDSGTSDRANTHSNAADAIVTRWHQRGKTDVLLRPLLVDTDPHVRCAAAGALLNHNAADEALPVLEDIAATEGIGLVSSAAETILRQWRKQQRADA